MTMMKKTTTPPSKKMTIPSKNMANKDDTTPILRFETIILCNNPAIPGSRLQDDDHEGRRLAFDAVTTLTPVLTSDRKMKAAANEKTVEEAADELLFNGIASMGLGTKTWNPPVLTPKRQVAVPDNVCSATSGKNTKKKQTKEDDDDETYIPATESEDSESLSAASSTDDFADSDDEDELDCGLRFEKVPDLYSPENATGSFRYTVLSPEKGESISVRRSSRHSFGSPVIVKQQE